MPSNTRKQQLEEMLKEEPNDPFLCYGLAMELVGEGEDEEAVRRFQELLEVAPEYVPGYLQAGQALVRLGRYKEARTLFSRGITTARKQADEHAAQEMEGFLAGLGE
jgi:predicted Zn-dependent protease